MARQYPGTAGDVERSVIVSSGGVLRPVHADLEFQPPKQPSAPLRTLAEVERAHIADMLREAKWVIGGRAGAAARLGLPRTTLIYRMRKLGIARDAAPALSAEPPERWAAAHAAGGL